MNLLKRGAAFWATIIPGLFLIAYNIGTGSITTMASSGAEFGMSLTWALLLSCVFTYFLVIAFSKYTMVTGNTALWGFRTHFGKSVTIFILLALLLSEMFSSVGIMGVVTEVLREWSKPLTANGEGFNQVILACIFCALLYYTFWQGRQSFFEKILSIFVFIMGLCFLLTMFIVIPDPGDIIAGMVPKIPEGTNSFMIVAGMVGTTMGAILYVVRSILISEKGWKISDMKIQRRDAIVSVGMMFVLSFAIMACAAGTLFPEGLRIYNAIDMVKLMEPLAGRLAISIFVAGIVSAGLSTLFPIILLGPWLICDYLGIKRDMTTKWARALVLVCALSGLYVPVFGGRPVFIMIFSQSLMAIATPLIIGLMMILLNRRVIMGDHAAKIGQNIIYGIIFIFSVIMAIFGIKGIIDM